jgi:hypothetical protein
MNPLLAPPGWKRKAKYHRRSLAECAIFRLETLFSDKLRARDVKRQRTEVMVRCLGLNWMTKLVMPQSYVCEARSMRSTPFAYLICATTPCPLDK